MTDRFAPGDADRVLVYGRTTDKTLVGDWNGDGTDTLGVRRDDTPVLSPAAAWARAEFGTFEPVNTYGEGDTDLLLPEGVSPGLITVRSCARGDGIRITAKGEWTIKIQPMETAPLLPESGSWDSVFLYAGDAQTLAAMHEGDAEFRVLQWNGEGSERTTTLVDTTGAFKGDLNFSAGPSVIRVTATDLWALTPR